MKYLVTGLPRSRTLWMSKFLPNCVHEVAQNIDNLDDLRRIGVDGISDSGLGFWLEWILENLKVPVLVIDRNIDEVEKSLFEMGLGLPITNFCELIQAKLLLSKEHPLVLWVKFEDLNARMEEIWHHLLPDTPFDQEKFEQMRNAEIVIDIDGVKQRMAVPHKVGSLLLREVVPFLRLKETDRGT